jgi:hypothetical protein
MIGQIAEGQRSASVDKEVMVLIGGGIIFIDDKARGLHEGYLVTPTVQADALTASDDRWSQLHSASPASGAARIGTELASLLYRSNRSTSICFPRIPLYCNVGHSAREDQQSEGNTPQSRKGEPMKVKTHLKAGPEIVLGPPG